MSQENRQPVAAPAPPRRRPEYTPVLSNREADKPQQVRDRAMAGTARTPVGFMNRSSRGAGATGVWYIDKRRSPRRRDREASSLAISAAWRSSLVNIPDANVSCGACARTQTVRTCRIPPSASAAFSMPRGRADHCGMPACPARRNGRRWPSPRQMRKVELMMVTYRLPICFDIRVPATASLTAHATRLPVPTCPTMAASPTGAPLRHGPRAPAPSRATAPNGWIAKAAIC